MEYRSVADLADDTRELVRELPRDADVVAGIPRSGLLPATLCSVHLDTPVTDVDGLCNGSVLDAGERYGSEPSLEDVELALVVDDSVATGRQLTETRRRIETAAPGFDVEYAAVYVSTSGHEYVDHWASVVPRPRVFEWNLRHHPMLGNCCVTLASLVEWDTADDVIPGGSTAERSLADVDPAVVPEQTIGWLVTDRPERDRNATESWLDEHGVSYGRLVMRSEANRKRPGDGEHDTVANPTAFKAGVYAATDAHLFVEPSRRQAVAICERTNRPVFCTDTNELVQPGGIDRAVEKTSQYCSSFAAEPITFARTASEYVLSRAYHGIRRRVSG